MRRPEVSTDPSVTALAAKSGAEVVAAYAALVAAARELGSVRIEVKQTSLHLVHATAFAGVRFQRAALVLTLKAAAPIVSARIWRSEQVSKGRWHEELKLSAANEVDAELRTWLAAAHALAAPR